MSARVLPLVVLATALLPACGPEADCSRLAKVDPTLQLGTGSAVFRPLADGDDLEVAQGPQGGMHVYGSLRTTGIYGGDPDDPLSGATPTSQLMVEIDGVEVAAVVSSGVFRQRDDGFGERVGEIVPFATNRLDDVAWRDALFLAMVQDTCGTQVLAEVPVRLTTGCGENQNDN